jgi:hypothetical protein|tara:strand:- start:1152 stop:1310 length:159 start_codon:yes stop_codon:yes gene_type:complete
MAKKSFKKDKKGREETWEWEETPEVLEAVAKLQATKRLHNDMRKEVSDEHIE